MPGEKQLIEITSEDPEYEIHLSRVAKVRKAINLLRERAIAVNNTELRTRAENLQNVTTILGLLGMDTNLMVSDAKRGVFKGVHSGRRRNVLYLSTKLLDNLKITSPENEDMFILAAVLNQGQRFLDKYNYLNEDNHLIF